MNYLPITDPGILCLREKESKLGEKRALKDPSGALPLCWKLIPRMSRLYLFINLAKVH